MAAQNLANKSVFFATDSDPAEKKPIYLGDSAPPFIKKNFMYLNICINIFAKLNFNIFIHFSLMKSIK